MRILIFLALCLTFHSHAVTLQVTRSDDPVPDGCFSNDCSLREAVIAANETAGLDTLLLNSETYQLDLVGFDDLAMVGDLDITDDLVISGTNLQTTLIDANLLFDRIFDIKPGVDVEITELALLNSDIGSNNGGGIRIINASMLLTRLIVSNNTANRGGGIHATSSVVAIENSFLTGNDSEQEGGAVFMLEGHLSIHDSQFIGNQAGFEGGGIYVGFNFFDNDLPNVSINNSLLVANVAQQSGGGLSLNSTAPVNITAEINNSYISNNQALAGGGLKQFGSINTTIEATTFFANQANIQAQFDNNGGAINARSGGMSGAGSLVVVHSLFTENSALDYGGAVWLGGLTGMTLQNSTISGNSAPACGALCAFNAASYQLIHSTVFNNSTTQSEDIYLSDDSTTTFTNNILATDCGTAFNATILSEGGNIESPADTCQLGAGTNDIVSLHPRFLGINPNLLAYGGPTQTHIINKAFSPAIGNAIAVPGISTDQRYFSRDAQPDSGATEQHPGDIDLIFKDKFEGMML